MNSMELSVAGKISVIIPVYNAERWLEKCLHSIELQSYQNFEVILINDGSTDGSLEVCNIFAEKSNKVAVIDQANKGVSAARNAGIDYATGEWICFVDPDDELDKECFSFLIQSAERTDSDIIAATCVLIDEKSRYISRCHFFPNDISFTNRKDSLYLQLMDKTYCQGKNAFTAIGVPWAKLYRRSLLESRKLHFDCKLRRMQDNIFNCYAFYYANKITYIDKPLYYYRVEHFNSLQKSINPNLPDTVRNIIHARHQFFIRYGFDKIQKYERARNNEIARFVFQLLNEFAMKLPNKEMLDAFYQIREEYISPEKYHQYTKTGLNITQRIELFLLRTNKPHVYKFLWTLVRLGKNV